MFPFYSVGLSTAPYRPYPNADRNGKITYTYREGATPEMLQETMRHYKHAVAILAAGGKHSADSCPKERADYGACDYPRVEIFGDIWVRADNGVLYPFTINICNEYTTADMLINAAWEFIDALGGTEALEAMFPHMETPRRIVNIAENNIPTPEQSAQEWADNKAKVESTSDSGTLNLGQYDNEKDYRDYHGKVVSFIACKIQRKFYPNTGKPYFEAYGYYKGNPSKYPIYGLQINPDSEYTKQPVKDFVANISTELVTPLRIVCYVNVKGDKTYFNVNRIDEL